MEISLANIVFGANGGGGSSSSVTTYDLSTMDQTALQGLYNLVHTSGSSVMSQIQVIDTVAGYDLAWDFVRFSFNAINDGEQESDIEFRAFVSTAMNNDWINELKATISSDGTLTREKVTFDMSSTGGTSTVVYDFTDYKSGTTYEDLVTLYNTVKEKGASYLGSAVFMDYSLNYGYPNETLYHGYASKFAFTSLNDNSDEWSTGSTTVVLKGYIPESWVTSSKIPTVGTIATLTISSGGTITRSYEPGRYRKVINISKADTSELKNALASVSNYDGQSIAKYIFVDAMSLYGGISQAYFEFTQTSGNTIEGIFFDPNHTEYLTEAKVTYTSSGKVVRSYERIPVRKEFDLSTMATTAVTAMFKTFASSGDAYFKSGMFYDNASYYHCASCDRVMFTGVGLEKTDSALTSVKLMFEVDGMQCSATIDSGGTIEREYASVDQGGGSGTGITVYDLSTMTAAELMALRQAVIDNGTDAVFKNCRVVDVVRNYGGSYTTQLFEMTSMFDAEGDGCVLYGQFTDHDDGLSVLYTVECIISASGSLDRTYGKHTLA